MDIPGLGTLQTQDPAAARALQQLVYHLATHLEAEQWARQRLGALRSARTRTALLGALVEAAREQSGLAEVWAVLWTGDLGKGHGSFESLCVGGKGGLVPAPDRISRTVVAEVALTGTAIWTEQAQTDARFADAESVLAGPAAIGCLPLGAQGVLYLSGTPAGGRLRSQTRLKLEALTRLASALLVEAPPQDALVVVPGLVGTSRPMQELFSAIRSFAPMPWPALILGETGTGKEAVARALHQLSPRADGPFVAVNCAAIPEELAESVLFGHERGAFTGADRRREGVAERARNGTLFLDEVGELPPRLQAKLLRLLQEGTFERVGGEQELRFSGRVVAATLRPLDAGASREGVSRDTAFRTDLYHRLAACVLRVPPLRERREDLPALARALLERARGQIPNAPPLRLAGATEQELSRREWAGNVRELENTLKTAIARAIAWGDEEILPEHLDDPPSAAPTSEAPSEASSERGLLAATENFQRSMVRDALKASAGNRLLAAERLGVSKQWLYRLLAKWGGEP